MAFVSPFIKILFIKGLGPTRGRWLFGFGTAFRVRGHLARDLFGFVSAKFV